MKSWLSDCLVIKRKQYLAKTKRFLAQITAKSQQHLVFPGGLPSKYYPGPRLLNFGDLTRTGAFSQVWPLTNFTVGWKTFCKASRKVVSVAIYPEDA